jgi:hypothetical protein
MFPSVHPSAELALPSRRHVDSSPPARHPRCQAGLHGHRGRQVPPLQAFVRCETDQIHHAVCVLRKGCNGNAKPLGPNFPDEADRIRKKQQIHRPRSTSGAASVSAQHIGELCSQRLPCDVRLVVKCAGSLKRWSCPPGSLVRGIDDRTKRGTGPRRGALALRAPCCSAALRG